jgi:hypothetical protein
MSSIERLTDLLTAMGDTGEDYARWTACIGRLEQVDSSFSEDASNLIEDSRSTVVRQTIKMWVTSGHRIDSAEETASWVSDYSVVDYTAARYVLEDAAIAGSLAGMGNADSKFAVQEVRLGHHLMLMSAPRLIPDLLTASPRDIDSYCRPMAVAASILCVKINGQFFKSTAPAFITWAAAQPDLDAVLTAALHINSVNAEEITERVTLLENTHNALHNGLL